jgi:glutathione peroxidase
MASSAASVFDFTLTTIDGREQALSAFRGQVLLIVNVASECGFTPQYADLQTLSEKYAEQGLVVLGVPANEFGRQEPGTNAEIQEFCTTKFHVTFPMFEKIVVKGVGQHPLYHYLTEQDGEVTWNFNKFLVSREGNVLRRFESSVEPLGAELTGAIEEALGHVD